MINKISCSVIRIFFVLFFHRKKEKIKDSKSIKHTLDIYKSLPKENRDRLLFNMNSFHNEFKGKNNDTTTIEIIINLMNKHEMGV